MTYSAFEDCPAAAWRPKAQDLGLRTGYGAEFELGIGLGRVDHEG